MPYFDKRIFDELALKYFMKKLHICKKPFLAKFSIRSTKKRAESEKLRQRYFSKYAILPLTDFLF
jgi:hypothetical protein